MDQPGIAAHIEHIEIVTKPSHVLASSALGLDPQKTENSDDNQELGKLYSGHLIVCKNPQAANVTLELLPFPHVQPARPKTWEAHVWDSRLVWDDGKYHMFSPGKGHSPDLNPPFFLKVSDEARDGQLVYEDIGPDTPELGVELAEFAKWPNRAMAGEIKRLAPLGRTPHST